MLEQSDQKGDVEEFLQENMVSEWLSRSVEL